jgi:hypothetical protein
LSGNAQSIICFFDTFQIGRENEFISGIFKINLKESLESSVRKENRCKIQNMLSTETRSEYQILVFTDRINFIIVISCLTWE